MLALASQFDKDINSADLSSIRCGFEAEFASRVSRVVFRDRLADRLGIYRERMRVSNKYGASHGGKYDRWSIEADTSIPTSGEFKTDIEVVSPIMDLPDMIKSLGVVCDLIASYGRTASNTGLHLTFSSVDVPLKSSKFDNLMLLLFLGEHYWAQVFGRSVSAYNRTILDSVVKDAQKFAKDRKAPITYAECLDAVRALSDSGTYATSYDRDSLPSILARAAMPSDRRVTVNVDALGSRENKSRIEFRLPGGEGYEHKFDKISVVAKRFAYAMWASCHTNTDKYQVEYARKLYRLFRDNAGDSASLNLAVPSIFTFSPLPDKSLPKLAGFMLEHRSLVPGSGIRESRVSISAYFDKRTKRLVQMVGDNIEPDIAELFADHLFKGSIKTPYSKALTVGDVLVCSTIPWRISDAIDMRLTTPDPAAKVEKVRAIIPSILAADPKAGPLMVGKILTSWCAEPLESWGRLYSNEVKALEGLRNSDFSFVQEKLVPLFSLCQEYKKYLPVDNEGNTLLDLVGIGKTPDQWSATVGLQGQSHNSLIAVQILRSPFSSNNRRNYLFFSFVYAFSVQRALGMNKHASATALAALRTGDASTFLGMLSDWSFLDKGILALYPLPDREERSSWKDRISVLCSLLDAAKSNPKNFMSQFIRKAPPADVERIIRLVTADPRQIDLDDPNFTMLPKTGVASVDRILADTFNKAKESCDAIPVGKLLESSPSVYFTAPLAMSIATRATAQDIERALTPKGLSPSEGNPRTASLWAVSNIAKMGAACLLSNFRLPANKALADIYKTPLIRQSMMDQILSTVRSDAARLSSVSGSLYGETLLAFYTDFFDKPELFLGDNTNQSVNFGWRWSGFLYQFLWLGRCLGIAESELLGERGMHWYMKMQTISNGGLTPSTHEMIKFLEAFGIIGTDNGQYKILKQAESPLIALLFKNRKLLVSHPLFSQVLPEGYKYRPAKQASAPKKPAGA